jgi:hypothetical protein
VAQRFEIELLLLMRDSAALTPKPFFVFARMTVGAPRCPFAAANAA